MANSRPSTSAEVNPFDPPSSSRTMSMSFSRPVSRPVSRPASVIAMRQLQSSQRVFHSRRVKKGEVAKPWKDTKDPVEKWTTIIPVVGILLGIGIAGFLVWDGIRSVAVHKYCPVYMDDFSSSTLNADVWSKEIQCGGFGNGQFEVTTDSDENSYIKDGQLFIRPTLQDPSLIDTETSFNLTELGTCTSTKASDCFMSTNFTKGTIVNPVKSARLNTKKGASITYGKVEVRAMLPEGDWLWPAIWMLPVNDTYGKWPKGGEIDLVESRGNDHTYEQGGNNIVSSTIHWGPDLANDGWWRNNHKQRALHTTFSEKFHTFGLEWTKDYLFTYIDNRLLQIMYTPFKKPLWQTGNFPATDANGTRYIDPWSWTGRANTPFDQPFYLILNVAVGGTNGWFADGKSNKPWADNSRNPAGDFWKAKDKWLPTWKKNGAMVVDSVKMWQQCG